MAIDAAIRRYLPIVFHVSTSGLKKEAAGTFGGILWWIAEPLVYGVIYYFVFAMIFQTRTENFVAFLLIGLTVWRWISLSVTSMGASVVANAALMRQLHIPKIIFPLQAMVMETFKFAVALLVMWLILIVMGSVNYSGLAHLPVVFLITATFLLGLGLVASCITPFFPDIHNLIGLAFRGLLFLSGVFFESSRVPEDIRPYYYLNPFVTLLEGFRDVLVFGRQPDYQALGIILALGLVVVFLGLYAHVRLNRVFPRYLA